MERRFLFGDESYDRHGACYAIVGVTQDQMVDAVAALGEAKLLAGGEEDWELHAKTEFFDAARMNRSKWHNFTWDQMYQLYWTLALRLMRTGAEVVVGHMPLSGGTTTIPGGALDVNRNTSVDDVEAAPDLLIGDGGPAVRCIHGALLPFVKKYGAQNITFVPDQLGSISSTWYDGQQSASRAIAGMWFDVGRGAERILPTESDNGKAMLEIADAIAYVTRKTAKRDRSNTMHRFDLLHALFNPEMVRMSFGAEEAA